MGSDGGHLAYPFKGEVSGDNATPTIGTKFYWSRLGRDRTGVGDHRGIPEIYGFVDF
jgi:hypothetical protein